jgi:hypothetical protein
MKYRETITALKKILRKAFRIRSSILITELRLALSNVFIRREAHQRTETKHFKAFFDI